MRYLPLLMLATVMPVAAELRFENLEAKRGDWANYRFPVLQGDSLAVRRINTYLHVMELEGLPGRFERSPFERIWPKEGEIWGTNSLDYRIDTEQPPLAGGRLLLRKLSGYRCRAGQWRKRTGTTAGAADGRGHGAQRWFLRHRFLSVLARP